MIHYFAYGSNLHPLRLKERVPSAELVGTVELKQYCLTFHKKSHDDSSKCNIIETDSKFDVVHGAIYKLKTEHKNNLDKFEGKGFGYLDSQILLHHEGQPYDCFTYLAQESHITDELKPYHWYKELVVLGAKYLQFPERYISSIESVKSIEDPDISRRKEKIGLINNIVKYR